MSSPDPRSLALKLADALPKAELHVHLEGSIPATDALALARRRGVTLPGALESVAGQGARFEFSSFAEFIRLYVAVSSCLVEARDFSDAVDAVAAGMANAGIVYAEVTFTPMTHVARGVSPDAVLRGLAEGRARARQRGVELAWVFDIVRSFPDQAFDTLDLALRAQGEGVVALGVGGPEGPHWPTEPLAPAFARAKAAGLKSVPHAGEQAGPASIAAALDLLQADRIGHGIRVVESDTLLERVVAEGVPLEVCPSSNVALGVSPSWSDHPLPRLIAAGARVSLNTDDPALFSTDLAAEYRRAIEVWGWEPLRVAEVARAAVEHSFMPAEAAAALVDRQSVVWRELLRPAD